MKIVVTAGGIIWNESHPALEKYGSDVVIVRRTPDAAAELVARVGMDRNVLVLTDNDPRSFMPFQVLSRQFQSRRIHLFACLPFSYESARRKREILELLSDLTMVKSLCLVELDTFLNGSKKDETLGGLQLRIRNGLIGLVDRAVTAMNGLDEFARYRYDFGTDTYREDDLGTVGDELAAKLRAGKRAEADRSGTGREKTASCEPVLPVNHAEDAGSGPDGGIPQEPEDGPVYEIMEPEENPAERPAEQTPEDEISAPGSQKTEEQSDRENPETETGETPRKAGIKKRRSLFAFLSRRKD